MRYGTIRYDYYTYSYIWQQYQRQNVCKVCGVHTYVCIYYTDMYVHT